MLRLFVLTIAATSVFVASGFTASTSTSKTTSQVNKISASSIVTTLVNKESLKGLTSLVSENVTAEDKKVAEPTNNVAVVATTQIATPATTANKYGYDGTTAITVVAGGKSINIAAGYNPANIEAWLDLINAYGTPYVSSISFANLGASVHANTTGNYGYYEDTGESAGSTNNIVLNADVYPLALDYYHELGHCEDFSLLADCSRFPEFVNWYNQLDGTIPYINGEEHNINEFFVQCFLHYHVNGDLGNYSPALNNWFASKGL